MSNVIESSKGKEPAATPNRSRAPFQGARLIKTLRNKKTMKHANTLHLVLKGKWYDMIASGEKTEEYREMKQYWLKRILGVSTPSLPVLTLIALQISKQTKYERVCFHRGYTNRTMIFEIKDISVGKGKAPWGAPVDKKVIIIKLGSKIQ